MNWPHLHLMINHFPVIMSVVALIAALLGLVVRWRNIWLFAAVCLTIAGVSVGPVFLTGDKAGDAVSDMPRAPKQVIHGHEEAGETALFVVLAAGVIGAVAWRRLSTRQETEVVPPAWIRVAVLVASLAASGVVGYAALLGGMIYHGPNGNTRPAAWDSTTTPAPP